MFSFARDLDTIFFVLVYFQEDESPLGKLTRDSSEITVEQVHRGQCSSLIHYAQTYILSKQNYYVICAKMYLVVG
jgi:hypothetical protein